MRIEPYEISNQQGKNFSVPKQNISNSLNTSKLDIVKNIMPLLSSGNDGNSPISNLLSTFAPQTNNTNSNATNNINNNNNKSQNNTALYKNKDNIFNQYEQNNNERYKNDFSNNKTTNNSFNQYSMSNNYENNNNIEQHDNQNFNNNNDYNNSDINNQTNTNSFPLNNNQLSLDNFLSLLNNKNDKKYSHTNTLANQTTSVGQENDDSESNSLNRNRHSIISQMNLHQSMINKLR